MSVVMIAFEAFDQPATVHGSLEKVATAEAKPAVILSIGSG